MNLKDAGGFTTTATIGTQLEILLFGQCGLPSLEILKGGRTATFLPSNIKLHANCKCHCLSINFDFTT